MRCVCATAFPAFSPFFFFFFPAVALISGDNGYCS